MRHILLLAAISWIWNHSGSYGSWYSDSGNVHIYPPSSDYVQVSPGGEWMFVETCQLNGLTIDHTIVHGDSMEVSQEFIPLDTPTKPTTWGLLKERYR